ncbi:hypothetical protein V6U78_08615 [Marinospirillum sp. MEB164]|uniref:Uncharacterized protein n=1 Tax=Marinospirillum alkalitolerans TaxID=3123374 RepID=A0ABW8PZ28_9GAMM
MEPLESIRALTWCQVLTCFFFALLAGWHFHIHDLPHASLYFTGMLLVIFFLAFQPEHKGLRWLDFGTHLIFSFYTLISFYLVLQLSEETPLYYLSIHLAYPFLALAFFPYRQGLNYVIGFAVSVNFLLMLEFSGSFRATILLAFWAGTLLATLYGYTHQRRQQEYLQRLRRDPNTKVFNAAQLAQDQLREEQRAAREKTYLLQVKLQPHTPPLSLAQLQRIQQALLPYEQLYQDQQQQLVLLLPAANEAAAEQRKLSLSTAIQDADLLTLHPPAPTPSPSLAPPVRQLRA